MFYTTKQLLLYVLLSFLCFSTHALQGVDPASKTVRLALTQEPPTLNSVLATDSVSFWLLSHLTEGLMDYDKNNALVGGVAERWQLGEDKAIFWLRKNARWSNGDPVTAKDFVFAWRQVVKPENASQYAFIMYPIRNAEQVNRGELPLSDLGVKALDDYTLEVQLERPCPYFLALTAFASYRPLHAGFYQQMGQTYAADADRMLFNGPFLLSSWIHGASLRLDKNPHYWDSKNIQLNTIDIPYMTTDTNALFNLFNDEKIAINTLTPATISQALRARMKIEKFVDGSLFFLEFNFRPERLTANHNLRKAIQLVFDPQQFTNKVIAVPGNVPAYSLFPAWVRGEKQALQKEFPPIVTVTNVDKAREHLEKARQELGVNKIPPLVLLAGDTPSSSKQAEYLQNLLMNTLGLEIKIDKQIFKQRLAKMTAGEFDIVAAAWGPDYDDGMTFADLFSSWNENNRGRYRSTEYDHWVLIAMRTNNEAVRAHAFANIQRIITEDVVIIPQYERGFVYVQDPMLKGVVRRVFGGDPGLKFAYIDDKK